MMPGLGQFLTASFFRKPLHVEPFTPHWISNVVYRIHSWMGIFLFVSCTVVFVKELAHDHIHCITDRGKSAPQAPDLAFDSYCYISSTFTLATPSSKDLYPGVNVANSSDRIYHNYYMWVPYLLFIQSLSFFTPGVVHRFLGDGKINRVLQDLHNTVLIREEREDMAANVQMYLEDWYKHHTWWAIKLIGCDALNLVVVGLNWVLFHWYIDLTLFASNALHVILSNDQSPNPPEVHPFDVAFPKMTKCSMETFGPSGSRQLYDALCVLPVNVFNEKIFLIAFVLLVPITLLTILYNVVGLLVVCVPSLRYRLLALYISPRRADLREKLRIIMRLTQLGDWLLLLLVARNTDRVTFDTLVHKLTFPDYNIELEPDDEENARLLEQREARMHRAMTKGGRSHIRSVKEL